MALSLCADALGTQARALPTSTEIPRYCSNSERELMTVWRKRAYVAFRGVPVSDLALAADLDHLLTSLPMLRSDVMRLVRDGEFLPHSPWRPVGWRERSKTENPQS
ncbi:hypothetical protein GCM10017771_52230 [Streptomyces capitiformicae]|uniref:Uncharacterized protein n=1 Tax=Streptomyces capitiformicae TaxID=2014920 RepID=A0A918Z3B3_9ACTN|nr:hypothetical protein GCM10017771_52230 [Streptomyces capitiformicae]